MDRPKASRIGTPRRKPLQEGATFRVIDGREIAKEMDNEHQDLRFEHLGIAFSRVTSTSIFASTRRATAAALTATEESSRFDAPRYLRRSADHELYRLWQSCLTDSHRGASRVAPPRLIPLVNDSGVGKTSLVCEFASSLGSVLPVLLIQARDVAFDTESALVTHVLHELQGVLDPAIRIGEEAAVVRHLNLSFPLTVIVDGLDETHAPDQIRKAITYWLRSRLGEKSILPGGSYSWTAPRSRSFCHFPSSGIGLYRIRGHPQETPFTPRRRAQISQANGSNGICCTRMC
jgi:hypothetical protein